jgi:hypothetical protein
MKFFSLLVFWFTASTLWALPPSPKFIDFDLQVPAQVNAAFSARQIVNKSFVEAKIREWKACHPESLTQRSGFSGASDLFQLRYFLQVDSPIKSLAEIDRKNLNSGQVLVQPWSGHYWPYASGLLGARYFDPQFQHLYNWKLRYDYIKEQPLSLLIAENGQAGLDILSPSEKYDYIFGDPSGRLTHSMWQQGKVYYDIDKNVEGWMGICHGWAPAAIFEKRPVKSVDIQINPDLIARFVPAEIKAFLSYSWATNRYPAMTLGQRCYKKDPIRDDNQRLIDPECQDMNPATWHLTMVNQVGLAKKSFVMDATFDYEVWNQPVVGYEIEYKNLSTGEIYETFKDAVISLKDFKTDRFAKHRSKKAVELVGISMRVGYVNETGASRAESDSEAEDAIVWTVYDYDLEIDAAGNIIGGEWLSQNHPDFIWIPSTDAVPRSPWDHLMANLQWEKDLKVSAELSNLVRIAAENGKVLHPLVQKLVEWSQP